MTARRSALWAGAAIVLATAWAATGQPPSPPSIVRAQISDDPSVLAGEGYVMPDPTRPGVVTVVWLGTKDMFSGVPAAALGYCGVATTFDNGRHWTTTQPLPIANAVAGEHAVGAPVDGRPSPICGDPVGGVGPDGTVYAGAAAMGSNAWEQAFASRTTHGLTWDYGPTEMFGTTQEGRAVVAPDNYAAGNAKTPAAFPGRAFMAVDPNTGAVSTQAQEDGGAEGRWLVVSHDHGQTWTAPHPLDPDVQGRSAGPHAAARGVIALTYTVDPTSPTYLASPSPAIKCDATCLVFQTTIDDGATWDRHVITGADGAAASKFTAADPSDRTGRRFAVLLTTNSGHTIEMWRTADRGRSWTKRVIRTAAAGDTLIKPGLGYAPNGTLAAVWRTSHSDGKYDVSAAVSTDGGRSWPKQPVTLTNGPAPAPTVGQQLPGDDCSCNVGLTSTTLYTVWGDARTGTRELWFAAYKYA